MIGILFALLQAKSDIGAENLFSRCLTAMENLHSLQAKIETHGIGKLTGVKIAGNLRLEKPNRGDIDLTDSEYSSPIRRISDGKLLAYRTDGVQVALEVASKDGDNLIGSVHCVEAQYFFDPQELKVWRSVGKGIQFDGTESVGGVKCTILRLTGGPSEVTNRILVGPTGAIYGLDNFTKHGAAVYGTSSRLTQVKLNPHFNPAVFNLDKQFGRPIYSVQNPSPAMREIRRLAKGVQEGQIFPDIPLESAFGKKVSLKTYIQSHRVTVIDFWSVFCAPCRSELRDLSPTVPAWAERKIGFVPVDILDSREVMNKYWATEGYPFETYQASSRLSGDLGIIGFPTTYVLDRHGRLVAEIVGVSRSELDIAISKAEAIE